MNDPSSAVAKGAIGAANGITAAICLTTNNKPSNVCSLPVIKSLQTQIKAQSSSSSSRRAATPARSTPDGPDGPGRADPAARSNAQCRWRANQSSVRAQASAADGWW